MAVVAAVKIDRGDAEAICTILYPMMPYRRVRLCAKWHRTCIPVSYTYPTSIHRAEIDTVTIPSFMQSIEHVFLKGIITHWCVVPIGKLSMTDEVIGSGRRGPTAALDDGSARRAARQTKWTENFRRADPQKRRPKTQLGHCFAQYCDGVRLHCRSTPEEKWLQDLLPLPHLEMAEKTISAFSLACGGLHLATCRICHPSRYPLDIQQNNSISSFLSNSSS